MIAGWVIYCLVASALIAVAAASIDELLTRRGRAARWVWLAAMLASLLAPASLAMLARRAPRIIDGAVDARSDDVFGRVRQREALRDARARETSLDRLSHLPRIHAPQWLAADRAVTTIAILCILLATVRVAFDSWLLYRDRRRWNPALVDGERVLRSNAIGPAIVGLIDQRIVIPEWADTLSADEQRLMLAHEREHVHARDGILASVSLLLALCMPWSPAIWWAYRRLRTAIEVDCDRRVLRAHPDVARYGRLLVSVAERAQDGSSLSITGFSERAAPLARRLRAMTRKADMRTAGLRVGRDAGDALLTIAALVMVVVVLPPTADARVLDIPATSTRVLPRGAADSIVADPDLASMKQGTRVVAAATDLPVEFVAEDNGGPSDRTPVAGRCPSIWRDPRTGNRVQLSVASVGVGSVVQHGDTAWTRVASVGLYRALGPHAYGMTGDQLLRVSCGAATKMVVAGAPAQSQALSDLETSDDRARRIAATITGATHRAPNAVELYAGRLNVVVTDSLWMRNAPREKWAVARQVWSAARDAIGRSAMPETLAFSVRIGPGEGTTQYVYSSMMR